MRVVVDTNVFVGACLGSTVCLDVLRVCLMGRATPVMATALLAEYEAVLSRPELQHRSRLNPAEREELLDILLARCEWVRIFYSWRPNLPDEGDNHLVELGVAAAAEAIITRNRRDFNHPDLRFPQLAILSPEDFLARLP